MHNGRQCEAYAIAGWWPLEKAVAKHVGRRLSLDAGLRKAVSDKLTTVEAEVRRIYDEVNTRTRMAASSTD